MTKLEKYRKALPIAKRLFFERLSAGISLLLADKRFKRNVFDSKSSKRALFVCLPEAFKKKLPKYHTSLYEMLTIARILDSLGYQVDTTTDNNINVDLTPYDIIFGGRKIQAQVWRQNIKAKTIFFSPGAHPFFCFEATVKKNLSFKKEKGEWLTTSSRYLNELLLGYYVDNFADHVIVYGSPYVLNQYLKYDNRTDRYSSLPAFYFDCHKPNLVHKDFSKAKFGICWFGSLGLIHKGLDIAIDIALSHPEINLHICGASVRERDFWHYYQPFINNKPNIINHGFVNIESQEFVDITSLCSSVIHPSISEGGAASVLNVVANAGLIPIYSKACGLDLSSSGYEIEDATSYEDFEAAVLAISRMPDEDIRSQSIYANAVVRDNYSFEQFQDNMYKIIKHCIDE